MSDYRVLRDFAFEGRLYSTGQILRQSHSVEAKIISERPWPSFFTAETTRTETRARVRRQPKRDWLAAST